MTSGFVWDWSYAISILPALFQGLRLTVAATVLGSVIATILGFVACFIRIAGFSVISTTATLLVQLIRATPFLIQLYLFFYIAPKWGVSVSAFATGVGALGIYYSAYVSEIARAGIESLPAGQWEASLTLGLPLRRVWLGVVLPQVTVSILPVLGNMVIGMFKETALLSTITIMELLAEARTIGSYDFRYIEPLTLAGVLYFIVSYTAARGVRQMEVSHARRG